MTPEAGRNWLREFIAGATQPSVGAMSGAVGVALACFVVCALLLTPGLLASNDPGYFLVDEEDEYAWLTCELLRIRQISTPLEGVVLVGSSSIREAISDEDAISESLQNAIGRPVDVICLDVAGLRLWEKAQACYCLEDRLKGVVVIQIDPLDLSLDRETHSAFGKRPRLATGFEAFNEELRDAGMPVPWRTGNFFLDNYGFFAARPGIVLNLFAGPKTRAAHLAETWRPITPQEAEAAIEQHEKNWKNYEKNRKANFDTYRRIVTRLKSKGIEVVLLEGIRNRQYDDEIFSTPEMRSLLSRYREEVRSFAEDVGATYLDLYDEAGLTGQDFVDTQHIRSDPARDRFTRTLSGHLTTLLERTL